MLKVDKLTNAEKFKMKRYADYQHGPVKVYTPEEIAAWESGPGIEVRAKIERQRDLTPDELRELDRENALRVEREYKELMENREHDYGRES
jgi:ferredoxin-fold anticodon binding domain-containing protein